jgi:hypothetical protein
MCYVEEIEQGNGKTWCYFSTIFKGFMANSVQTNWSVAHIAYAFGDQYVPLQDNEQTCSFHWNQSMDKHTNNKSSQR